MMKKKTFSSIIYMSRLVLFSIPISLKEIDQPRLKKLENFGQQELCKKGHGIIFD